MANPLVDQAIQAITNATSVEASAIVFANSVPKWIQDAKDQAVANGATEAELQPFADLNTMIQQKSADLVAALAANTPISVRAFKASK